MNIKMRIDSICDGAENLQEETMFDLKQERSW